MLQNKSWRCCRNLNYSFMQNLVSYWLILRAIDYIPALLMSSHLGMRQTKNHHNIAIAKWIAHLLSLLHLIIYGYNIWSNYAQRYCMPLIVCFRWATWGHWSSWTPEQCQPRNFCDIHHPNFCNGTSELSVAEEATWGGRWLATMWCGGIQQGNINHSYCIRQTTIPLHYLKPWYRW